MMNGLGYRIFLTCLNIFCPPAAVLLLCGPGWDCILNCAFFILAVIPSHIHGFYLSCVYFHRRAKVGRRFVTTLFRGRFNKYSQVRKGRYPGGPKTMIDSEYVLRGGASQAEVDRLWRKEFGSSRRTSRRYSGYRDDEKRSSGGTSVRDDTSIRPASSRQSRHSAAYPTRQSRYH